ncbi:OmpA family protein [Geminicoccaceae bacterium 1502E]|nr:OmpA family protein [Geminicoccaceae bacterium 1502E]
MTIFGKRSVDEDEHWITVSDLMSGLMVIFLFIAIAYIRPMLNERNTIRSIAVTWQQKEVDLVNALHEEFKNDLPRWNAELDRKTLVIRFNAPDVLFAHASADIRPRFEEILSDFFPRYLRVLGDFKDSIEEVRIEGHTSVDWGGAPPKEAYFKNMALSQERTRSVLDYVLNLPDARQHWSWAISHITANGLSSAHPVLDESGLEDPERSRRVDFRVRTNAKQEIVRIVETVAE